MKRKPKPKPPEKSITKLINQIKDVKALEELHTFAGKPFGFMNTEWTSLQKKLLKTDELWWLVVKKGKEYNWGYGIVRNKKVVDKIFIEVSKGDCYGVFAEEKK